MQESETRFYNVLMSEFRIPIMFKSVGRYSEMGYTMGRKKGPKSKKFAPIIWIKSFNGVGEIVFNKFLEDDKGEMNIRFTT